MVSVTQPVPEGTSFTALGGGGVYPLRHHLERLNLPNDVTFTQLPGRRRVYRLTHPHHPELILKIDQDSASSGDGEASKITMLSEMAAKQSSRLRLPRIASLADGAHTQYRIREQDPVGPDWVNAPEILRDAASQLKQLHLLDYQNTNAPMAPFPITIKPSMRLEDFIDGPGPHFDRLIATSQALRPLALSVHRNWGSGRLALTHGDAHRGNILASHNPPAVTLIDWEQLGLADPSFDVGSLLGQIIIDHLQVNPEAAPFQPNGAIVIPAARTFVNAYFERNDPVTLPLSMDEEFLQPPLVFAAWFLITRAASEIYNTGLLGIPHNMMLLSALHITRAPVPALMRKHLGH